MGVHLRILAYQYSLGNLKLSKKHRANQQDFAFFLAASCKGA